VTADLQKDQVTRNARSEFIGSPDAHHTNATACPNAIAAEILRRHIGRARNEAANLGRYPNFRC